jgi:SAM-dependent MidA family methyltransferase
MPSWMQAWLDAAASFYAHEHPADHFQTAADSIDVAHAMCTLVLHVAAQTPTSSIDVVDVGGGDGRLIVAVMERLRGLAPAVAARCRPVVVELRPRPPDLPRHIGWIQGAAPDAVPDSLTGLLIAHELLDDVPLDVVHVDDVGTLRVVNVDVTTGSEKLSDSADDEVVSWCDTWVADRRRGDRVEVGLTRDSMWADLSSRLASGIAVAVDYTTDGRNGTLTGYRDGRQHEPVPDGSMNLTAHVHLGSCAATASALASETGRTMTTLRLDQRTALAQLAPLEDEPVDQVPQARLMSLARRSRRADVSDPSGLGAFEWLVHCIDVAPPPLLATGTMPG